ncbi:hypothetical protein ACJJTC_009756 [Scirpophaga incertulas]
MSTSECAGCKQKLPDKQNLKCNHCNKLYDLECANVSVQRFYNTMTPEHKLNWQCQACYCKKPKAGNIHTPIRCRDTNYLDNCNEDRNVTLRKPTQKLEIQQINTRLNKLLEENKTIRNEIIDLNSKIKCIDKIPESESKKIVMFGLEEFHGEPDYSLHRRINEIFYDYFNVDLTGYIEETYRIGRSSTASRPLAIELISKRMTKYLIEHNHYLQGTGYAISEFLDKDKLTHRKNLKNKMYKARSDGLHAVIRNNELFINGKKINLKDDSSNQIALTEIAPSPSLTQTNNDGVSEECNSFRDNRKHV